jgi:hypothetical protein
LHATIAVYNKEKNYLNKKGLGECGAIDNILICMLLAMVAMFPVL